MDELNSNRCRVQRDPFRPILSASVNLLTGLIFVVTQFGNALSHVHGEDVRVISAPIQESALLGLFQQLEIGDVESGEKVVRRIRIENNSLKNLELLSVVKSCSCVKVDLPNNRVAKPGESVELNVEVDVDRYSKNLTSFVRRLPR